LILQANGILYVFLLLQVLALDKRFLDPRRTLNPSQAEKEEGIIPLTDSLPIIPQVYFSSEVSLFRYQLKKSLFIFLIEIC
jgi:hypothetical protein